MDEIIKNENDFTITSFISGLAVLSFAFGITNLAIYGGCFY